MVPVTPNAKAYDSLSVVVLRRSRWSAIVANVTLSRIPYKSNTYPLTYMWACPICAQTTEFATIFCSTHQTKPSRNQKRRSQDFYDLFSLKLHRCSHKLQVWHVYNEFKSIKTQTCDDGCFVYVSDKSPFVMRLSNRHLVFILDTNNLINPPTSRDTCMI